MSTITYRALNNGDPLWGGGQNNFISDLQAVGQAIRTRLLLFQGEWWEDTSLGAPMFQSILGTGGARNTQAIALIIQQRILGTPYVTGISNVNCTFNSKTRAISFSCAVTTQFGTLTVNNQPGTSASLD